MRIPKNKQYHPESMESMEYLEKLKNLHKSRNIECYSLYMFNYVKKYVGDTPIKIVYDIGSGSGDNSLLLRKLFNQVIVYSFDYVKHNLDYGVSQGKILNPVLTDIYDLNKAIKEKNINKADFVFLGDVIEHLEKPSLALNKIYNSLKKGGIFVLHTPNKFYTEFFKVPLDPTHINEFYPKDLKNCLLENNFEILKFLPSGIPLLGSVNPQFSQRLAYSIFGDRLFNIFHFLGPSIFVILKKK